ncbi:hypothetical protein C8R44DRAFT_748136 [Mycena epipterygia]|nr:hypothetical protein C8R44DRAFT_748136 [Mycena epipterygia]
MSVLPHELCDMVISFCDQRSLAPCSLVCRNWVPCSRIRLFATKPRPLIISPSSLPEVLLLVDSPSSTISPYITSLVLKDWTSGPASSGSSSSSFYPILPRIAGRMVAVECLTFHAVDFEEMSPGALKFLIFYFKDTLKTLELRDCYCRSFASLIDLVCSFSILENLSLHRLVRLDPKAMELEESPPPLDRLRSIHVHGYIKKELFRWIMATKGLDIEVVTIGPLLPGEGRVVGKFLKSLKNNLKHITLSGESTSHLHREIDLKHNGNLTSIHFANLMLHHRGSGGRASMNCLQLSVCVHSKSAETLEVIDWLALSTCLDKPQFVCLTRVQFAFSMSRHKEADTGGWWVGYVEMAERFVREKLPQYQDTGILFFDFDNVKGAEVACSDDDSD